MNIQLLRTLIALQTVPAPDPQPESLEPKPPWEGDDEPPIPPATGRNLCGGTMQTLDPLAYDGWSDKPCPGCDGCRDAEPPPVDVLPEEEFARAFEARMQQVGEREEYDDPPTLHAPPRGRVVSQAKGPNRAADRARGIYGKRGKK